MSRSVGLGNMEEEELESEFDEFQDDDSNNETEGVDSVEGDNSEMDDDMEDGDLFIDEEESNFDDENEYDATIVAEKTKKSKLPRRMQNFSKIASDLGYKGDYFSNQCGDFAAADDFEEILNNAAEARDKNYTGKKRVMSNNLGGPHGSKKSKKMK